MPHAEIESLRAGRRRVLGLGGGWAAGALWTSLFADAAETLVPVRVAVVGTGARGSDLIRSLTTIRGVDLVALADDYPPHLERAAAYAGPQARRYSDFRRLLDEAKPQAVVVAVPLHLHHRVASESLAAGADVFCEKTMCRSIEEARALAAQVESSGRVFQVGLQRRANPIYRQAAAMVQSGVLGDVTAVKAQWHRHNNWRRPVPVPKGDPAWSTLERKLNWRLYREFSGGLMTELGSHQMDVVNWLLGAMPKRVMASGGVDYWRDGREVCDNVFCTYEYELPAAPPAAASSLAPSSRTVRVTYSSLCNNAYEGAAELVMGTKGTLYLTSTKGLFYREKQPDDIGWQARSPAREADPNASIVTSGKTLKLSNSPWAHRGEPLEIDNLIGDDTRDELVAFVDHVRRGDPRTICDAREGLCDAITVLTANRAVEERTMLDLPAV